MPSDPSRHTGERRSALAFALLIAAGLVGSSGTVAQAGGSAENAVLIVDPSRPDALAVGNAYRAARDLPASNVIYMKPLDDGGFVVSLERQLAAFRNELVRRGIADHVDYVVLAPTAGYRSSAGGLLSDACHPAGHLGIATAYTLQPIGAEIAAGGLAVTEPNRYFSVTAAPRGFRSTVSWRQGVESGAADARSYFLGASLGYTGARGNSLAEIRALIARSVAADGSFPTGTFSFHKTGDPVRSGPRHDSFPAVRAAIEALGGATAEETSDLPIGRHDCLGILTGAAYPQIDEKDFTILPGAFCDHLTSWAADFGQVDQTKVSAWIRKGASLTAGAVEEPCNYPGKFPRAELHLFVFQGMTLGESYLRATEYVPFQALLYGDPLTRPFAHVPAVKVTDLPASPVRAAISLTVSASTTHATAGIASFDLLVDGVRRSTATAVNGSAELVVDPAPLGDGVHDLRVLAHDDSALGTTGRWIGTLLVDRHARTASVGASTRSGDLTTAFPFVLDAGGAEVVEIRLLQSSRVVASTSVSGSTVHVFGRTLGSGPSRLHAEATFLDGRTARSAALDVHVSDAAPSAASAAPIAFDATLPALVGGPCLVELPATFADAPSSAQFQIVDGPDQATVLPGASGSFRLITPNPDAARVDALTFRVVTPGGTSRTATITFGFESAITSVPLTSVKGKQVDRDGAERDRFEATGSLQLPPEFDAETFDPETRSVRIEVGDPARSLVLRIEPGSGRWKRKRGRYRYRYRSPRQDRPRVKLRFDPRSGAYKIDISRVDLPSPAEGIVRTSIGIDDLRATSDEPWNEVPGRPGRWKLAR